MHLVRHRVEDEVAVAELLAVAALACAPEQRPQPGLELAQRERLDQVIVGPDVEPLHAVVNGVARGQHQDRSPVSGLAHAARHLVTVEAGHQDVEDHRVRRGAGEDVERLLSVGGERHVVAFQAQRTLERAAHRRLIVDHKYSCHGGNDRACA